jgi:hypothetical protein
MMMDGRTHKKFGHVCVRRTASVMMVIRTSVAVGTFAFQPGVGHKLHREVGGESGCGWTPVKSFGWDKAIPRMNLNI